MPPRTAGHCVVFCQQGYASILAVGDLAALGVPAVYDLRGGFDAWAAAGLPSAPESRRDDRRVTDDLLALTVDLPARSLAAGEIVYREGDAVTTVLVLVEGQLEVDRGGVLVNRHTTHRAPSSARSARCSGQPRSASVTAVAPTVVRNIGNPDEFFAAHPELGVEVARQLAARLSRLTAYIVDVQHQFADREDHLGVFGELLGRIAGRPPNRHRAGFGPLARLLIPAGGGQSISPLVDPMTTSAPGRRRSRSR